MFGAGVDAEGAAVGAVGVEEAGGLDEVVGSGFVEGEVGGVGEIRGGKVGGGGIRH